MKKLLAIPMFFLSFPLAYAQTNPPNYVPRPPKTAEQKAWDTDLEKLRRDTTALAEEYYAKDAALYGQRAVSECRSRADAAPVSRERRSNVYQNCLIARTPTAPAASTPLKPKWSS